MISFRALVSYYDVNGEETFAITVVSPIVYFSRTSENYYVFLLRWNETNYKLRYMINKFLISILITASEWNDSKRPCFAKIYLEIEVTETFISFTLCLYCVFESIFYDIVLVVIL